MQQSLVPHVTAMFDDADPITRLHAAAALGKWGLTGQAVQTVIRVLDDEHPATRE